MAEFAPEMRLLSPTGERLYLTAEEREKYLNAAIEDRSNRTDVLSNTLLYRLPAFRSVGINTRTDINRRTVDCF